MRNATLLTKVVLWGVVVGVLGSVCFGQTYWKRTFAGDGYFNQIISTSDGNCLAVGRSNYDAQYDGWLMKINPNGDILWTKTYGGNGIDELMAVVPTPDGNFLLVGTYSIGNSNSGWLLKVNADGDTLWTKIFADGSISSIVPTPDENFLLAGFFKNSSNQSNNGWVVKIAPDGNSPWSKTYTSSGSNASFSTIVPTMDGNYLCTGEMIVINDSHGWAVKITPDGDTLWEKIYGGQGRNNIVAVASATDGNCLLAGKEIKYNRNWLAMTNPNGDLLWMKESNEVGVAGYFTAIVPTTDGNFLAGSVNDIIRGTFGWLVKIDPNGNALWTKNYNDAFNPTAICRLGNGDFLVGGNGARSSNLYALQYIVDDRDARRDTPFTFKIPSLGADSLNYGFSPLRTPSGMSVTPGGTITWTPTADSVYMEHVEYIVVNDVGRMDTLTFNIFVNSDYHAVGTVKCAPVKKSAAASNTISVHSLSARATFILPQTASSVSIYDITGRQIGVVIPTVTGSVATAVWPGPACIGKRIPAGKYFAKVAMGKSSVVKPFLLVK